MPHEGAGLEQVGAPAARAIDAEVGAAAGKRKARQRIRREPVVGADRGAIDAARGVVRARRGVAVGGLRTAEARRPHAPAWRERHKRRRLGVDRRQRVIRLARLRIAERLLVGVAGRTAGRRAARAAPGDERIGHHAHELVHRIERGLLAAGRGLAGGLRQVLCDVAREDRAQPCAAPLCVEGGVEPRADRALVDVQPGKSDRGSRSDSTVTALDV